MELYHYNHNHDPRNGRFASSNGPFTAMSYKRDIKKLKKLEDRADLNTQRRQARKYGIRARKAAKVARISGGIALGSYLNLNTNILDKPRYKTIDVNGVKVKINRDTAKGVMINKDTVGRRIRSEATRSIKTAVGTAAAATAAVSTGVYGYNKVKQKMAQRRLTEVGHAKAVEQAKQQTRKILDKYANVKMGDIYADLDKMRGR